MAARAAAVGLERIHLFTFRDLDDPAAGGSELHAARLASHWAAAGLEVIHRTGAVAGRAREVDRSGFRVVREGGRVGVYVRSARSMRRTAWGPGDGIVDVFHGIPFFAPVWARSVPQVGIVHHVHVGVWRHLLPPAGAAVGWALERLAVPLAYRGRSLVTVAPSTRQEVIRWYQARPERVTVAGNGVDPQFSPGGARSAAPLVVVVARLMPQKAVDDAIAAFRIAQRACPEASLVIVGDGPERAPLEAEVAAQGPAGAVRFVGRVPEAELIDWYRRAWVVASASVREGFGLTLAEAAACGTPVVARRIPGHVDAVADGASGLLADDVVGMGAAIARVLTDRPLREALGEGALHHARGFRWERSAELVLDALCAEVERARSR
jgi:glycosyltransferase involved in cell wall biosynthesis